MAHVLQQIDSSYIFHSSGNEMLFLNYIMSHITFSYMRRTQSQLPTEANTRNEAGCRWTPFSTSAKHLERLTSGYSFVSSQMVTGPSFSNSTCICAPKIPSATRSP